jgi:hypothetical protein
VKISVQTTVQNVILTFVTVMPEGDRLWRTLGEKESHGVTPAVLEFSKKIEWRVPAGGCHIEEGLVHPEHRGRQSHRGQYWVWLLTFDR